MCDTLLHPNGNRDNFLDMQSRSSYYVRYIKCEGMQSNKTCQHIIILVLGFSPSEPSPFNPKLQSVHYSAPLKLQSFPLRKTYVRYNKSTKTHVLNIGNFRCLCAIHQRSDQSGRNRAKRNLTKRAVVNYPTHSPQQKACITAH